MSKRYVTIVYEIVDDDAWSNGGNPLHYNHHGLQAVCVSVGDLAAERDAWQAEEKAWALGFPNAAACKKHGEWLEESGSPEFKAWLANAKAQRGGG